jgi:hypothetical protein
MERGLKENVQHGLYSRILAISNTDPTKRVDLGKVGGLRRERKPSKKFE